MTDAVVLFIFQGTWKAVCACRVLQGLSQAGFYPAIACILSKWSHPSERGKFITFIYTGMFYVL